jgi:allantoin racemase
VKILIINPNTSEEMTRVIADAARMYARPDTVVEAVHSEFGPSSIEGFFEEYVAAHAMLEKVLAVRGKYDAFIVACYGDPGLYGARELANVPVIGIAEASFHFASMLGHSFSILIPLPHLVPFTSELVRLHGFADRLASIRPVDLAVLELDSASAEVEKRLIQAGRKAVEEDGAEVICLGCAGMALMDKTLEAALGVPVLDGTVCAVKMAEAMYDYGLKTSKVAAFRAPSPKEYTGCSDLYDNV